MGENHFAALPVALYGVVLFMAAIAYRILQRVILVEHGGGSVLARAVGHDLKGNIPPALYAAAATLAFYATWFSGAIYILVALMWLVPDRRIEKALADAGGKRA